MLEANGSIPSTQINKLEKNPHKNVHSFCHSFALTFGSGFGSLVLLELLYLSLPFHVSDYHGWIICL